jgi:hypothetical protein
MYTARYLIFVLPAYLILLAAGAVVIAGRSRLLAGILLAALLVLNFFGLLHQSRTPLKADFRSATEYVDSRRSPGDLLIFQIPYGRYSFDYYLSRLGEQGQPYAPDEQAPLHWTPEYRIYMPLMAGYGAASYRWAEGLYTNGGMDQDAADSAMERLTVGTETAWLIATEVSLWDERGLVQDWLERNATMTDQVHYVGVSVYQFSFP